MKSRTIVVVYEVEDKPDESVFVALDKSPMMTSRASLIAEVKRGAVLDIVKNRYGHNGLTDLMGLREYLMTMYDRIPRINPMQRQDE